MISALNRVITPSRSAAMVPVSRVARCHAIVSMPSAWWRDSASAQASWSAANSLTTSGIAPGLGSNPSSGLRRNNSAATASLRAAMCASSRSHAHSSPISS